MIISLRCGITRRIKLWSIRARSMLLEEAGSVSVRFQVDWPHVRSLNR